MNSAESDRSQVGVVGSGPAGLAAAFRLRQAGLQVRVFEASDRVGGKMRTSVRDGFVIDEGASVLPSAYTSLLGVINDAGLTGELTPGATSFGIAGDRGVQAMDTAHLLRSAAGFRLVSARSSIKMTKVVWDLLRMRTHLASGQASDAAPLDTESAGDYARRRLNPELMEYVVDPAVRALVGKSADEVSSIEFFYALRMFIGTRFLAFRQGMATYPDRLAGLFDVELQARVVQVEQLGDEVQVIWQGARGVEHVERLAGCVVAVPGTAVAPMVPGLDAKRAEFLRQLSYTKMVNLSVGLSRPPTVPIAYIYVTRAVHPGLDGLLQEHVKLSGRAPAGKGLLGLYTMSDWAEELFNYDDEDIIDKALEAADRILPGTSSTVEFATVHRWDPMVVHRAPGHYRKLAAFNQRCQSLDTLVQLAGDYIYASNLNGATAAGEQAARRILSALAGRL